MIYLNYISINDLCVYVMGMSLCFIHKIVVIQRTVYWELINEFPAVLFILEEHIIGFVTKTVQFNFICLYWIWTEQHVQTSVYVTIAK